MEKKKRRRKKCSFPGGYIIDCSELQESRCEPDNPTREKEKDGEPGKSRA